VEVTEDPVCGAMPGTRWTHEQPHHRCLRRRHPQLSCHAQAVIGAPSEVLIDASATADLLVVGRISAGAVEAVGDDDPTLEVLTREECLRLVATLPVGRIAVNGVGGPPHVVPVNYVLDGDVIVFRTDPGTKLSALRKRPVTFQTDLIDAWSGSVARREVRWRCEHRPLHNSPGWQ
jgi:hypothetical protein